MNAKQKVVIVLTLVMAALIGAVIGAYAAPVTPNEPLPGCYDDPNCPLVWYVESWEGRQGYLVDNLANPQWRMIAECQQSTAPAPTPGQKYIRIGSRKLVCDGCLSQDVIAIEIVDKPDEKPNVYKLWLPWNQSNLKASCTCLCHYADVYKDGVYAFTIDLLEYPAMGYNDYYINLYPGQYVDVYYKWCGSPASEDDDYQWSTAQINCDGQTSTTLYASGDHIRWGCPQMNGANECRFTFNTMTCYLCRGRSLGTDPVWN